MNELQELEERVLAFIVGGSGTFDELLRATIEYQRRWNRPLADYWQKRGFLVGSPLHELPGVPTEVFRHIKLVSAEAEPVTTFRTSGTTSGLRGQSHRLSTRAYDCSALTHAQEFLLREPPYRFLNAVLDPSDHPDSSLSHMVALFNADLADSPAPYYLTADGLDVDGLSRAITGASQPLVLIGTAFALAHFAETTDAPTPLADGSLLIETGGFKGKHQELERDELYAILSRQFAIPMDRIRSEYSMTELSSQLYSLPWEGVGPQILVPPRWCKVTAVHPRDLSPLPPGGTGLLQFVDLANVDTVVAVQTSDLGEVAADGHVVLHGRAPGATPRGCSLATEEILALTQRRGST